MTPDTPRFPMARPEPPVRSLRPAMLFAAGVVIVIVLSEFLVAGLLDVLRDGAPATPATSGSELGEFASSDNWPDPESDLARVRESERINLETYGWIDPKNGVIRIPIQRAMELLAQRATKQE